MGDRQEPGNTTLDIIVERDGHMRTSVCRHDIESGVDDVDDVGQAVHKQRREGIKPVFAKVEYLVVGSGVER